MESHVTMTRFKDTFPLEEEVERQLVEVLIEVLWATKKGRF